MEIILKKQSQFPQKEILVTVIKPFFYHIETKHKIGEQINVLMKDINLLVRKGYAEIVVNKNGFNTSCGKYPYVKDIDEIDF